MTRCSALRPGWTPLTVFLMILGFILFWPLGLAMLAYILWGDRFHQMADDAMAQYRGGRWTGDKPVFSRVSPMVRPRSTGNVAFDDYRDTELRRLEEERRKLDAMRDEFDAYLRNLRQAKDREEFDRFMRERNNGQPSSGGGASDRPATPTRSVPFTVNTYRTT
jgi:hypothetical protein